MLLPRLARTALAATLSFAALMAGSVAPGGAAPAEIAVFAGLSGAWSGNGTLTLSSGGSERLRCKATYQVLNEGATLQQRLRCASDSYRFDVDCKVSYNPSAAVLTGTWTELNYGAGGFVTGSLSGTQIQAKVDGGTFTAAIGVNLRGGQQSVTIRAENSTISAVAVTMHRA